MAKRLLGLKAEEEMINEIDIAASNQDINRTEFVRRAISLYLGMEYVTNTVLLPYLKAGLPESLIAANLLIYDEARKSALDEVLGKQNRNFSAFRLTENGYLTGEALFACVRKETLEQLKLQKES